MAGGFTLEDQLRITRRLLHEGSGMMAPCRSYVLTLRDQLADADQEALVEYAVGRLGLPESEIVRRATPIDDDEQDHGEV